MDKVQKVQSKLSNSLESLAPRDKNDLDAEKSRRPLGRRIV